MHDPFDNPETAAARQACGGRGWGRVPHDVPAAPILLRRPVPAGRGVSASGAQWPRPTSSRPGIAGRVVPGSLRCRSPAPRGQSACVATSRSGGLHVRRAITG